MRVEDEIRGRKEVSKKKREKTKHKGGEEIRKLDAGSQNIGGVWTKKSE